MSSFDLEGGGVELVFERDWCARHLEPLHATWPKGAGVAMVYLFQAFAADPRVREMAPKDEEGLALTDALGRIVAECAPLCCFLGDEVAKSITDRALA